VKKLFPLLFAALVACGHAGSTSVQSTKAPDEWTMVDTSSAPCSVSYDGILWYAVPAGTFPPIDVRRSTCGAGWLSRTLDPPVPHWAKPDGPTQTEFLATSLQQAVSLAGMRSLERTAAANHVPMTWMVGHPRYLDYASEYNAAHAANGDDAQSEYYQSLHDLMAQKLPWYVPKVSILTAGIERDLPRALSFNEHAFWGIAWNSHGTDGTHDYGAPWGTYCADLTSYKRPQPDGGCGMLAFEWTARDLTRGYLSGREDAFSTDPDDLLKRGGFTPKTGAAYARSLVDAYAAAGETQPIVMLVQQETAEEKNAGDPAVLDALFGQAARDGMKLETMAQAADDARAFSAAPRAVAFPFIPGGTRMPSVLLRGDTLYPATIDYHDAHIAMTFLSGHTVPSRLFLYSNYPVSRFDHAFADFPREKLPRLTGAHVANGRLTLSFQAPRALRYGAAIWTDPARLRITDPRAIRAGRAGIVLVFDVKKGANDVRFRCPGCTGTTFVYAL
jgi:hypothetical protein